MSFFTSKKGKKFMTMLYGIGAAIVILGALFKILHWKFANEMLMIGLFTEAAIFFISAFEEPPVDYDWTLVYPELANMDPDEKISTLSPAQQLDNMLEKAKVDNDLVSSLGDGLRKISTAASGLGEAVSIAESTTKYSQEVNAATQHLENINAMYAMQLESNKVYTESTTKFAENMESAMQTSAQMQSELNNLTRNLSSLNSVYGNMLTAMNFNK